MYANGHGIRVHGWTGCRTRAVRSLAAEAGMRQFGDSWNGRVQQQFTFRPRDHPVFRERAEAHSATSPPQKGQVIRVVSPPASIRVTWS